MLWLKKSYFFVGLLQEFDQKNDDQHDSTPRHSTPPQTPISYTPDQLQAKMQSDWPNFIA